jgi:pimeloyl-ACP methyl ester carboxylesterase
MRTIWLHGFASSPASSKAAYVAARFAERGGRLEIPDLNEPAFFDLTISRMLQKLDDLVSTGRVSLVGSSLGGYTAALWAAARPARVERLALLAPAFDLAARWEARMGPDHVRQWRERGWFEFDHYGTKRKERLSTRFLEEAGRHEPFPLPQAPTLVLQGRRDETVDPELAREFTRRMQGAGRRVNLIELDDGHELAADLPRLWTELSAHLLHEAPRPTP